MQILLLAIGSHGDVHPFIGLGKRLQARGHRVTVMASAPFGDLVTRAGFEFVGFGTADEYKRMAMNPALWHPIKGFKLVAEFGIVQTLRPVYEAVASFHARHPAGEVAVVGSSLAVGGVIAHEKLGVPYATVHLSPSIFRSAYEAPKFAGLFMPDWLPPAGKRLLYALGDRVVVEPALAKPLNAFRAEVGLRPVKPTFNHHLHPPQRVIGMFPAWFAAPQPDWPPQTRLTGFPLYDEADIEPLSPQLEAFLAEGAPPIAFTPGSANWAGQAFLREAAGACRILNRRGILLTRHRDQVPADLPPGVIHVDFAPFSLLLPRCAALSHHGGIGTTSQGLAAGVPQLVMPMAHDQLDNAHRVARLGVGRWLPPKKFQAARVAAELGAMLDSPETKAKCAEVARRFVGVDALGEACDWVEALVATKAAPTVVG